MRRATAEAAALPVAAGNGQANDRRHAAPPEPGRAAATQRVRRDCANGDLLKVENVKVLFDGFKALDIDSFSLGFYELRVIIGPNGAGKTTLCDVISGKTRPRAAT